MIYIYEIFSEFIIYMIGLDHAVAFTEKGLYEMFTKALMTLLKTSAPIAVVSFLVSIIATISQIGFLYAPEVLTLKLNRVNPINGFFFIKHLNIKV